MSDDFKALFLIAQLIESEKKQRGLDMRAAAFWGAGAALAMLWPRQFDPETAVSDARHAAHFAFCAEPSLRPEEYR